MFRPWKARTLFALMCLFLAAALAATADAGLGDKLKKKIKEKAGQKTSEAAEKATGAAEGEADGATGSGEDDAGADPAEDAASTEGEAGSNGSVSSVSTKFDFVPGDSVIFADDFTRDELGEFPAAWKLAAGTFEVAEMKGERWLRCVSTDGHIGMNLPNVTSLPEFWTLEFEFHATEPMQSALIVSALTKDKTAWEATFPSATALAFRCGEILSTTPLEGGSVPGRHHVMFMARGKSLKAYIDRQRMASVPDVSGAAGMPDEIDIRLWASTKPMITNVRFAEGCRPAKDLLAEGKLVTYGIHFATGSDVVQPESAPVLRQIATYLDANSAVKLRITGHTDNTGTAAGNLDLSKRRAASVAQVLSAEFKIAADRFATDGKGDTDAITSNGTPEGRAMNRRVEFTAL